MRIGELKTLLALAIGDADAIREGCDWIRNFNQLNESRQRVYRCIESLIGLEDSAPFEAALLSLYGAETLAQAKVLLAREDRFYGLQTLGMNLDGCEMHQQLLAAYDKVQRAKQAAVA